MTKARTTAAIASTFEITRIDELGIVYLRIDGKTLPARRTVPVSSAQVGGEAVVMFEDGDLSRPIILGVIENSPSAIRLESDTEVVLRCGEAGITLTSSGHVTIRGSHISSSARGVHRIRGGAVKIN